MKLTIQAKKSDLGWVPAHYICRDNYHQIIRRLRRDLKPAGVDVKKLVENNGCQGYRFSVPPDHISWDDRKIRLHAKEQARLLDAAADIV